MSPEERADLKARLIQGLLDEWIIRSKDIVPKGTGYHCYSCSCDRCYRANEDCVCQTNDILQVIEEVFNHEPSQGTSDHP
jgi:hypothetical protein